MKEHILEKIKCYVHHTSNFLSITSKNDPFIQYLLYLGRDRIGGLVTGRHKCHDQLGIKNIDGISLKDASVILYVY